MRSILDADVRPREIVVADQSDDRNAELAGLGRADCEVHVVRPVARGRSVGRNAGVAAARGDVVAFVADDVRVAPGWLGELLAALERGGGRSVATGRVVDATPEAAGARAPSVGQEAEAEVAGGRVLSDPVAGDNCAFRRATFAEIGGFDERLGPGTRYPSADDNDLGYRALEAGYTVVYAPEAVVVRRCPRTSRDLRRDEWVCGVGQGGFYGKHLSLRDGWILWRLTCDLLHRNPLRRGRGRGDLVYLAGVLVGVARWLVRERLLPRVSRLVRVPSRRRSRSPAL